MTPRAFLVVMTAVAVVGDSLLHPFYPQYFRSVLGVDDPVHVGLYVAACSLTVLLSFPAWAVLSRRFRVLRLLIVTQICAAILACLSFTATTVTAFWAASLAMMVFKASYLLIYPYVMSLEDRTRHPQTIGLLAFVVYFGHILAALAAGLVFQLLGARTLFLGMAAGDLLQTALCLAVAGVPPFSEHRSRAAAPSGGEARTAPRGFFVKLGLVMFALYFSAEVTAPFFSEFWEARSTIANRITSGLVFALPGVAALAALLTDARRRDTDRPPMRMTHAVALVTAGLLLQLTGVPAAVIAGRCLYGWALFRTMVQLDLLVFQVSAPDDYAVDFSRANLFQGLGVMLASSVAGSIVGAAGVSAPFLVAATGFLAAAALHGLWVRPALLSLDSTPSTEAAGPEPEANPS